MECDKCIIVYQYHVPCTVVHIWLTVPYLSLSLKTRTRKEKSIPFGDHDKSLQIYNQKQPGAMQTPELVRSEHGSLPFLVTEPFDPIEQTA